MPDLKEAFAESLRVRRAKKHWSQQQLADASSVSVDAIGKYERGACSPNLEGIAKLSAALECTPNDLFSFPKL